MHELSTSRRLRLLCLVFFLLAAGWLWNCQPVPNMRGPQKLDPKYETQLTRWTSSAQIYHSLDSIMTVHGTLVSPAFREALGNQYVEIFGIDPGRVDSDLELIATSVGRGHEFFIFADTNDRSWNNLDARDSVWRLGPWGAEDQLGVPPLSIHRFRGRGPNLRAFFPYLNEFGRSYLVIFPIEQANGQPVLDPQEGSLTLRMSSAFGSAAMNWKVKG